MGRPVASVGAEAWGVAVSEGGGLRVEESLLDEHPPKAIRATTVTSQGREEDKARMALVSHDLRGVTVETWSKKYRRLGHNLTRVLPKRARILLALPK